MSAELLTPPGWSPDHDERGDDFDVLDLSDVDSQLVEAFTAATAAVTLDLEVLGLRAPAIAFSEDESHGDVARLIDGTESSGPVIVVFTEHWSMLFTEMLDAAELTLLHELGHAYLRTRGTPHADDEAEEDAVEAFAQSRDSNRLIDYADKHGEDD